MAQQTIDIGSSANDGTGDPLRTAFDKANDNFDELYDRIAYGTSFPVSPATDDVYYRTDRHIAYYYDGTRWLSQQQFPLRFDGIFPNTATAQYYAPVPFLGTYGLYMTRFETVSFRDAAGEWDIILGWLSLTNVTTAIVTVDGNGTTDSNWIATSNAINAVLDANAKGLRVQHAEISGAANFHASTTLWYRLIG